MGNLYLLKLKLAFVAGLSILLSALPGTGQAHELNPTVGDFRIQDGQAEIVLRLNVDAFLAGIDLDAVQDTNDAPNAADYDAVRALSAEDIAARAPALLEAWNAIPLLSVDGTPVTLESAEIDVPSDLDIELARVSEWTLRGDIPSDSQIIVFNWPAGGGPMVLRQQDVTEPFTGFIQEGGDSVEFDTAGGDTRGGWGTFAYYIPVGFDHILPQGLDHILFVLGLFFLSTHLKPLLWQVSAFTLAHTVTLAFGALGIVSIPGSIVEPLIAASIVYVAVENIFFSGLSRWRTLVVFGFGLLHGLGFASVLGEFGLPEGQFIPALIGFNVGVELGQLTVIAMAAAVIWLAVRAASVAALEPEEAPVQAYPVTFRAVSLVGSLVIALIGVWWVIERVFL